MGSLGCVNIRVKHFRALPIFFVCVLQNGNLYASGALLGSLVPQPGIVLW